MTRRKHLLAGIGLAVTVAASWAQTPQTAAASASGKLAIVSLVGDALRVTVYRERAGSNLPSHVVDTLKMPGPALDHAVMRTVLAAAEKARPGLQTAMLRVPAAGSAGDPNSLLEDDKVVAGHALLQGLRQQGFTHLLAVTRLRTRNVVRLAETENIGTGMLEGMGFYIDNTIQVQRVANGERAQGVMAPHLYVQLSLIDVGTGELAGTRRVTASSIVSAADNPKGLDPWGALTPEQKMRTLDRLIEANLGQPAAELMAPR